MQYEKLRDIVLYCSRQMEEMESIRQDLFQLPNFCPYAIYDWFCEPEENFITPQSLASVAKVNEQNAKLLVNFYDLKYEKSGSLEYREYDCYHLDF